jgi:hypothetical protein
MKLREPVCVNEALLSGAGAVTGFVAVCPRPLITTGVGFGVGVDVGVGVRVAIDVGVGVGNGVGADVTTRAAADVDVRAAAEDAPDPDAMAVAAGPDATDEVVMELRGTTIAYAASNPTKISNACARGDRRDHQLIASLHAVSRARSA